MSEYTEYQVQELQSDGEWLTIIWCTSEDDAKRETKALNRRFHGKYRYITLTFTRETT